MKTEAFLDLFPGHKIFAAFPDDDSTIPPRHYHGGYSESTKDLREMNLKKQWGIFFAVNLLDRDLDPINPANDRPRHRTKKMVTHARAIFMDADDPQSAPLDEFPLSPSIIVESSPGKYHYYWLIHGMTDQLDEWNKVQIGLINKYNGDNKAKDLARVLRLPGYYHNKKDPFLVEVVGGTNKKYKWKTLLKHFPAADSIMDKETGETVSVEARSVNEHVEDIRTGKDYHGSLTSLCHQMKSDGMANPLVIAALQGMMNLCSDDLKAETRWQMRYNDIERDVRNYKPTAKMEELDLPSVQKFDTPTGEVPWPPGLFGQLCTDAYNMARYQYPEVAIVSALGLIAGICGRKFNVDDAGLNIYATLIMDTGMGKDSINQFITRALTSANDIGTGMNFLGPVRFTGPRAVFKSLEKKRSQVCVFTEAGLLLNSKAGDRDGLKRMLLGLFNKSGKYSYSGQEQYSSDDDDIKPMRAPALTIINESTPSMLLEVFQKSNSIDSGEVPRQLIFRIIGDKPLPNTYHHKNTLSNDCLDKIKHLVGKCHNSQTEEDPKAWMLEPDKDVREDMMKTEDYYVGMQNENRHTNSTKYAMATRAFYKGVRLAGVASAFNHKDEAIHMPEWEWAKAMIEHEMRGLEIFFRGGGMGDELSDVALRVVGNKILEILHDTVTIRNGLSKVQHKAGLFKNTEITQALKNQKEVIALGDTADQRSNPITGIEKCMNYLIRNDMIYKTNVPGIRAVTYQVTDTFMAAFK